MVEAHVACLASLSTPRFSSREQVPSVTTVALPFIATDIVASTATSLCNFLWQFRCHRNGVHSNPSECVLALGKLSELDLMALSTVKGRNASPNLLFSTGCCDIFNSF
jgi:hypothetical protein